jgi:hypothetical protein
MIKKTAVVVTSISPPNRVLQALAKESVEQDIEFIIIGDASSPADFYLEGCQFYDLQSQAESGLEFAAACPQRKYSRKNIGYLLAAQQGASIIVETDDDNFPYAEFWKLRQRHQFVASVEQTGWLNVYRYFSDATIWPRGLPLDAVNDSILILRPLLPKQ